tara:strand:- start:2700 stop:2864 length:165 start_codon:yes stop_codon:yes gene_type:complete
MIEYDSDGNPYDISERPNFDTYIKVLRRIGNVENAWGSTCLSAAAAIANLAGAV